MRGSKYQWGQEGALETYPLLEPHHVQRLQFVVVLHFLAQSVEFLVLGALRYV